MRNLVLALIIFAVGYSTWYYGARLFSNPVEYPLFLTGREEVTKVIVGEGNDQFEFIRGTENEWVVARGQRISYDRPAKVDSFLTLLFNTRSNLSSQERDYLSYPTTSRIEIAGPGGRERVTLYIPTNPATAVVASHATSGAVLSLPPITRRWRGEYLHFDAYRERRLVDLDPASVDSIHTYRGDSLLHKVAPLALGTTAPYFIAPALAPYADYFDEIAHRDREYGRVELYAGDAVKTITVYRDSLWPQPYVLVGKDYPRRFLGYDALR